MDSSPLSLKLRNRFFFWIEQWPHGKRHEEFVDAGFPDYCYMEATEDDWEYADLQNLAFWKQFKESLDLSSAENKRRLCPIFERAVREMDELPVKSEFMDLLLRDGFVVANGRVTYVSKRANSAQTGMTAPEITKLVDQYIGSDQGYLVGFSYASHEGFYAQYCGLDIDVLAARKRFGTTRRTFIGILRESPPDAQAKIVRGVFDYIPTPEEATSEKERSRLLAFGQLMEVVRRLESDGGVDVPLALAQHQTVKMALRDAEVLIKETGPVSAIDRAHTALHGHLKTVCAAHGLTVAATASVTEIFGHLRKNIPRFAAPAVHDVEAKRLMGSIATALDSLNTIRNRGSVAHPNEILLEAPEAVLYINLARTLILYIDSKLA